MRLLKSKYPEGLTKDGKRNWRRKCRENFKVERGQLFFRKGQHNAVQEDVVGEREQHWKLYIKTKIRADGCGLFAIAFAEALCAGKDPHLLSFDQKNMRQHLQSNLEGGTITSFPSAAKPQRLQRRRVKISRDIPICRRCRLPWNLELQVVWELYPVLTLQGVVATSNAAN